MRAAGQGLHGEPGASRRELVDSGVIGQRMLGFRLAMFGDMHALKIARAPAVCLHALALRQVKGHAALSRFGNALDNRPISFLRLARAKDFT